MKPFKHKIVNQEGETLREEFILRDAYRNPINLTGITAKMQVRSSVDDNEDPPILELSTENGGIIILPLLGSITLYLDQLLLSHNGTYDVFLYASNGDKIAFILPSSFTVKGAITDV